MPRGAFVVNRFRMPPPLAGVKIPLADIDRSIVAHALALEEDASARLGRSHDDAKSLAALDARHVRVLAASPIESDSQSAPPVVRVRELASDVHDLKLLAEIAEMLVSGGV
jgi:hypothetical protein